MDIDQFRGYSITTTNGISCFKDTGKPTAETWMDRPCGHCGLHNTKEGHDGCLGTLPSIMNACCGHGNENEAYVQFWNKRIIRGKMALSYINHTGDDTN